ncbi:MAG: hypothetical protein Q9181_006814 [Wetmoreana brouardii]
MMVPPTFRDYWKNELEQSKKEDVKAGRAWMYAADLFLAQQEQNDAHELRIRKKADEERRRQDTQQSINVSFGTSTNATGSTGQVSKGWSKAPSVEMGKQTRAQVENLVQRNGAWNPHGLEFPADQKEDVIKHLVSIGFRRGHVEEAFSECRDREEALEWLLIHVPEDDLPRWSLPEGYTAGISLASGDPQRDSAIARLSEAGIMENPGRLRDITPAITGVPVQTGLPKRTSAKHKQPRRSIDWRKGSLESLDIYNRWLMRQDTTKQEKMLTARKALPAWTQREAIIYAVNTNQVTIISGETGSGKSTQSVQFILDDVIQRQLGVYANIICTQPRRISALGLADRVSDERCTPVGDKVGYAIRGESKIRYRHTKITFVTTGVLLRRLQTLGEQAKDILEALSDVSHVVIDKVHERSLDMDFLLILLRDMLAKRQDLKVMLISATLDANIFEKYFQQVASVGKCTIEGWTFPVEDVYLDDVLRFTGYTTRSKYQQEESVDEMDEDVASTIQSLGMKINYDLIA